MIRFAIVCSHPIQYYAPWFRDISGQTNLITKVFYLWDSSGSTDPGFGREITWDIPLFEGYEYEFVPNISKHPGSDQFWGLNNPSLGRALRNYGAEVILLIGFAYASYVQLLLMSSFRRQGVILTGDSHRLADRNGTRQVLRDALKKFLFSRCSAVLYVGTANHEYFSYFGVPEERLFRAPHAVDNDRFMAETNKTSRDRWRVELGIPESAPVVLFVGKFVPQKCPLQLVRAFKAAEINHAYLVLVGDGPLERDIRDEVGGASNVKVLPFQNQSELPLIYSTADLLVLPSYGPHETWGLVVNEAMAAGVGVIVSSHVGCGPDLVRSNGLIFEAGDDAALTNALRSALSDEKKLREWGAASKEIVKGYSFEERTVGLLKAIHYVKEGR